MTWPALTNEVELADFPNAPYPAAVIRAAEASVRNDCGWHIAPEVRETVTVTATHPAVLFLPTLRVVTVHSILDEDDVAVTGFKLRRKGSTLEWPVNSTKYWTVGDDYTVDLTHGFASAPDIVPAVAARCQRSLVDAVLTQRSETVGQRTTFEGYNVNRLQIEASSSEIDKYRLPPRFA